MMRFMRIAGRAAEFHGDGIVGTSQWPPLSGPMRRRRLEALRAAMSRAMVRRVTPRVAQSDRDAPVLRPLTTGRFRGFEVFGKCGHGIKAVEASREMDSPCAVTATRYPLRRDEGAEIRQDCGRRSSRKLKYDLEVMALTEDILLMQQIPNPAR